MRKGAQKEADQKANEVKPPGRREKKIQSLTDKKGFSPEDAAAVADGKTTEAAVLLKARDKQAANLLEQTTTWLISKLRMQFIKNIPLELDQAPMGPSVVAGRN